MIPHRRSVLISGLVAGAALAGGALTWLLKANTPGGDPFAGARFVDLQGKARSLSEWRGKFLVANFWATWCAPCVEEIPLLMSARRLRTGKDLEIVGIAIDQADKVSSFAQNMRIDYPILVTDSSGLDLIRSLGNRSAGLPFTVFLDRTGRPARTKLGVLRQPELDSILAALMSG